MCKFLNILIVLAILTTVSNVNGQTGKELDDLVRQETSHLRPALYLNESKQIINGFDWKYIRFTWEVDPAVRAISGTVMMTFQVIDSPMDTFRLELAKELNISKIEYHDQAIPFVRSGDYSLKIPFASQLPLNSLDSLSITYSGIPPNTGFGSFIQQDFQHGPTLWSLSEPEGAPDWWPSKKDLNDKIDSVDYFITVPDGNKVASNGLLMSQVLNGNKRTFHWKHRYPIDYYLVCFATTNYAEVLDELTFDDQTTMPLQNLMFPENEQNWRQSMPALKQQILFYSELFGKYPFSKEKYGHAQFGWGGGMEHQTMSFMINLSYGLMAHELGHQWFGDKVTCCSWSHVWLNEGFATFLADLCQERFYPNSYLDMKKQKLDQIVSRPDGSVLVPTGGDVNRIFNSRLSYSKGSYILHMLRWEIGDSTFFHGMRNYINDPALAYSSACTDDFRQHMEAVSGRDLVAFFKNWFEGEGYPIYNITWSQSGENSIKIKLSQTTSHPSVSFYSMHVPILFIGNGQDSLMVFDHTSSGQEFNFSLPFKVDSLIFDPRFDILNKNTINQVSSTKSTLETEVLSLSPNPVSKFLDFNLKDGEQGGGTIYIYDSSGEVVLKSTLKQSSSRINISELAAGSYYLNVYTDKKTYSGKFIKN
ncbi:MAG TPA: M1 family aminopeptidase [Saprospiraceae bacterium]|nr:M1 family aminopeptidase [Saprospiraceae bacterium]